MKKALIILAFVLVLALALAVSLSVCQKYKGEAERAKANTEALMTDVERYRVRDSLSAARVEALELTAKEYERFRAEDAALIRELKAKNRDLSAVNKTQAETIIRLRSIPKDTIVIRDSVEIPAIAVSCGDAWYSFKGLLTAGEFTGELQNRDSLILAESVKYKRFLGFLWKTKKIKDRRLDVMSRNPHTTIMGVEHIIIQTP